MSVAIEQRPDLTGWIAGILGSRPEMDQERVAFAASLYFSLFCNTPFWGAAPVQSALQGPGGVLLAASLFVAMTALCMLLLCLLSTRWTTKPLLAVMFPVTAASVYFSSRYSVYIDAEMVRNVLHTDAKEARELITPSLIGYVALLAVPPMVLLWRVRLKPRPLRRAVAVRLLCLSGSALAAALAIMLSFQNLSSLMRNHHDLRYLIAPGNWVVSLATVAMDALPDGGQGRIPVGTDARIVGRAPATKPRLLVIVVGETVRAHNWGLNGYMRQTTPRLRQIDPINFSDVSACGTSTEVSVPCMFSPYGHARYDKRLVERSESLLHVLAHAGIATLWRDNQTGCKGVCTGLPYESFEHGNDPVDCDRDGCRDQAMLRDLARTAGSAGDTVLVLHQLGNHGPSYFKRYSQSLGRFQPACESADLARCSRSAIVNAYDNATLNTDDFLARAIASLAAMHSRDTALIYLSDHGESLGENGLYLHGMPYAIAPATQTQVPMVMWFSPEMARDRGIDLACLRRRAARPASHDNLFHSVLGLMQVRTRAYDRGRDLFAGCERAGPAAAG